MIPATTAGALDDSSPTLGCYDPGVPAMDGEDVHYQFIAPSTGTFVFDTIDPAGINSVVYVTDECSPELVCNDNFVEPPDGNLGAFVGVELAAGDKVVVAVDSYDSSGGFTLNVAGPVPDGNCCSQRGLPAGCAVPNIELCVCEIDDWCCTFGWDRICVGEAIDLCGAQCG